MSERELKPCPFCGGEAQKIHLCNAKTPFEWGIACTCCGCSVGYYDGLDKAVAAWNRREAARGDCRKCEEGDGDESCPYYGEPGGCNDYYTGK